MNDTLSEQVSSLIAECRRLRAKSDSDDDVIVTLKEQYKTVVDGMENLIEDHRKTERALIIEVHQTRIADKEIAGLLNQVADLILQAARARIGNDTPAKMPSAILPVLADGRMPEVSLS